MTIFETYAEYCAANPRHIPDNGPLFVRCDDCGKLEILPGSVAGSSGRLGTGYAITSNNRLICYACADTCQRRELLDHSKSIAAYLSSCGNWITTWTGGKLGFVTWWNPCRLTRRSFWHDNKSYRSVRVRDVHGNYWTGRGSPGVCIKLRPVKGG